MDAHTIMGIITMTNHNILHVSIQSQCHGSHENNVQYHINIQEHATLANFIKSRQSLIPFTTTQHNPNAFFFILYFYMYNYTVLSSDSIQASGLPVPASRDDTRIRPSLATISIKNHLPFQFFKIKFPPTFLHYHSHRCDKFTFLFLGGRGWDGVGAMESPSEQLKLTAAMFVCVAARVNINRLTKHKN